MPYLTNAPSAVLFQDKIYCFYQSQTAHGLLCYTIFNGKVWESERKVPGSTLWDGPSAVVFKDKIYCFHQSGEGRGNLYYNVFDGQIWAGGQMVPDTTMKAAPSAVVLEERIYCFHQGQSSQGLYFNMMQNNRWSGEQKVPDTYLLDSPSVVALGGKIYCFHRAAKGYQLWYNIHKPQGWSGANPGEWDGDKEVANTSLSGSPGAAVLGADIYCLHQGSWYDGTLWCNIRRASGDWSGWSGDSQVISSAGASGCCGLSIGKDMMCFYRGKNNGGKLMVNTRKNLVWGGEEEID